MTKWPGWAHLPRESRDTLFLLAVIAWTVAPHLPRLPLWCGALTVAVLLWRTRLALVNAPLPGRWVLLATLGLATLLTLWSFRTLLGKEPGVTMAVVLMALKTLELRARRDAFVVFFLGFFLILTHFLYSQSIAVAAAMLVSVWGLLTALVLAHMPVGQPSLRQAGLLSARTALLGAPIMALMFVLFPRVGPLWGVPQDSLTKTGLSNTMRMGSVAEVALDDSVAMRLRFEGPPPPAEAMYFRGPVLTRFDGSEWRAQSPSFPLALSAPAGPGAGIRTSLRTSGPAVRYEMTLEPLNIATLPLLEATATAPQIERWRVLPGTDLQWLADRPIFERLRFNAEAHVDFQHGPLVLTPALRDHIELPPGQNPRTLGWAAELRRQPAYATADADVLAAALMRHIRTGGFTYTLAPGEYEGPHTIDQFWLDRREGFCEHFAAAFVVVMRALDVPARIVTGYQGIEPLPVDGYYLVRQSAAHAWAEYWLDGKGWVRADPTAAVAPERIRASRNLLPAPGILAGALGTVSPALLAQLKSAWETINNRWNQSMMFSRGQQFDLLRRLGVESPSWEDLALMLTGALSSLALVGAAWAWLDRRRLDPWHRLMKRLRDALRSLGIAASEHDSPRALAERVRERFGARADVLVSGLMRLELARYGRATPSRPPPALARELSVGLRALNG
ncbi:MAG: transglutaminase [Methylibium sp. NZG]|nr:MAG: transglutaminase [Methylibium sp. NZG]